MKRIEIIDEDEMFDKYRDQTIYISGTCYSEKDTCIFDEQYAGETLYDFVDENHKALPFSLYSHQLKILN